MAMISKHWQQSVMSMLHLWSFESNLECARLDMVMAQERARLAREQAEADAAIAADNRGVQPTQTATATTDIPCMLNLQATSAMSKLSAAEAMHNHDTCAKLGTRCTTKARA